MPAPSDLLGEMPTLNVWGERDRTIPAAHGREADEAIAQRAKSRLRVVA